MHRGQEPGGSPRRLGLGRYREVTVEEAKREAVKVIDRVRRGLDPDAPPELKEPTVADLAERIMETHVRVNCKPGTVMSVDTSLRLFIVPELGGCRLGKRLRHCGTRAPALAGVRFIDNDGEPPSALLIANLVEDEGEFLYRGDDDFLARLDEAPKIA